jgi:hypothetical protein
VEAAFQILKKVLCTAPILPYPQPRERFVVDIDTSNVRIGGVLSQVQDGQDLVIAYYSKTMNKKLLRHPAGTTGHRKNPETFS